MNLKRASDVGLHIPTGQCCSMYDAIGEWNAYNEMALWWTNLIRRRTGLPRFTMEQFIEHDSPDYPKPVIYWNDDHARA